MINPHKWLLTNFDCSAHFVRDARALVRTLSVLPRVPQSRETGEVIDYRDWGVPLGRRFRALKLWFVLRSYGAARLQAMLRDHIAWTAELAGRIAAEPDFELVTPPRLALLTFRYRPRGARRRAALDRLNERLLHALNDDGRLYLTQTRVRGRYVIRFAIGQLYTTRAHVAARLGGDHRDGTRTARSQLTHGGCSAASRCSDPLVAGEPARYDRRPGASLDEEHLFELGG